LLKKKENFMNENRRQILDMLATGKITTDEAERLLAALERSATAPSTDSAVKPRPKYLRVLVEDSSRHGNPTQVNVRVPMQLLRAGVRLASLIPVDAQQHVDTALHSHGVKIDLSQLKPENLEELVDQLSDLTVDVDDEKAKVRVFCE
jgi:D-serine deaminase-like pyridoxal phosphate-dependent protein